MIDQMNDELKTRASEIREPIETLYFGGGTPSLLTPEELEGLLQNVHALFSLPSSVEITLEVNPEDLTNENIQAWWEMGINRLSIGLQSLDDSLLTWMNRNHTAEDVLKGLVALASSPFTQFSVDILYGVPLQSEKSLRETLAVLKQFNIPHVSAYSLTVENKTLLHHQVKTQKIAPLNEDKQIEHYLLVKETLEAMGFEQYEISNYAKEESYAKHNTNYWKNKPYLGIGPGAHSFDGNVRRWNISNNTAYLKQTHWVETEVLSDHNRWNELWLTGLRTKWGVSFASVLSFGGLLPAEENMIQTLVLQGKMILDDTKLTLSEQGKLSADGICSLLFRVH